MPAGVPRASYTRPLAAAVGLSRQVLRDRLKAEGIFPFKDQERRALEYLIQKGYRDKLKKYRPIAEDAQTYLAQALNAPSPPKPTPGQNQELALVPSPSPSSPDKPTRWDRKLTPRLARLLGRSYPEMDIEALKRMARKIMRDGGMEPRSEDEAQALAVFQAAGYSIEGFEYQNTGLAVAPELLTVETTQLPIDLEKMPPQQLRLEIVKLRQQIRASGLARHRLTAQLAGAKHLLESALTQWWGERVEQIAANPNIRPPRTSKADHYWQLALDDLDHLEDT